MERRLLAPERPQDLDLAGFEAEVEELEAIVEDVLANELEWDDDGGGRRTHDREHDDRGRGD